MKFLLYPLGMIVACLLFYLLYQGEKWLDKKRKEEK